jgi:hypothetical protein
VTYTGLPALGPDLYPKGKAPPELAGANLLQSSDRAPAAMKVTVQ